MKEVHFVDANQGFEMNIISEGKCVLRRLVGQELFDWRIGKESSAAKDFASGRR